MILTLKVLAVEIIRRLWDQGHYQDNRLLVMIHERWIDYWVDWRTENVMRDVDDQVEELLDLWAEDEDPSIDAYIFNEISEGETPLGGEMRRRSPYKGQEDPYEDL